MACGEVAVEKADSIERGIAPSENYEDHEGITGIATIFEEND